MFFQSTTHTTHGPSAFNNEPTNTLETTLGANYLIFPTTRSKYGCKFLIRILPRYRARGYLLFLIENTKSLWRYFHLFTLHPHARSYALYTSTEITKLSAKLSDSFCLGDSTDLVLFYFAGVGIRNGHVYVDLSSLKVRV